MGAGHELGKEGERVAEAYLLESGWEVLDRNWRAGHSEIDIVVRCGKLLAFVEVKTRSSAESGDPLESITRRKRREVERAASRWLQIRGASFARVETIRFDAIAVDLVAGRAPQVRHLPDAWRIGVP